jgi:hypothetical protein
MFDRDLDNDNDIDKDNDLKNNHKAISFTITDT